MKEVKELNGDSRTMMLLHAKEELDAPPGGEAEHFEKAVEAMGKVVEHIELAYTNGDQALGKFRSPSLTSRSIS
jgi:hypothetical protein